MEKEKDQKEELYRRSLPIRMAKKLLLLSKSILPKKYYNLFYKISLKSYKALVRLAYLRFVIYHTLLRNKEKAEKCKLIYRVMPYSLVGSLGLAQTYDAVKEVIKNNIEGGFVECGVAQGGSSALIASAAFKGDGNEEGRKLFLFILLKGCLIRQKMIFWKKKNLPEILFVLWRKVLVWELMNRLKIYF
jgi:hypothetical protein